MFVGALVGGITVAVLLFWGVNRDPDIDNRAMAFPIAVAGFFFGAVIGGVIGFVIPFLP